MPGRRRDEPHEARASRYRADATVPRTAPDDDVTPGTAPCPIKVGGSSATWGYRGEWPVTRTGDCLLNRDALRTLGRGRH